MLDSFGLGSSFLMYSLSNAEIFARFLCTSKFNAAVISRIKYIYTTHLVPRARGFFQNNVLLEIFTTKTVKVPHGPIRYT